MTGHLTDGERTSYLQGTLPAPELLRVDDHLAACDACRSALGASDRIAAGVAAVRHALADDDAALDHPAHQQLVAYVDGQLADADRAPIEEHLRSCSVCADDVADLREVAVPAEAQPAVSSQGGRRVRPGVWYAATLGLAAAASLAAFFVLTGDRADVPGGQTGALPPVLVRGPVTVLTDGARRVTVDGAGTIEGIPSLDSTDAAAIVTALRTGALEVPPDVLALRGARSTLMGAAPAAGFHPLAPVATAVDGSPTFRWTALAGASGYVVSVFDADLNKVAESGPTTGTQWALDRALSAGQTYVWQVRARSRDGDVVTPLPPDPEARFRALTAAEHDLVAALRLRYADSPLALGVLLARAGLLDEAERQLDVLAQANAGSAAVRQLLSAARGQPAITIRPQ